MSRFRIIFHQGPFSINISVKSIYSREIVADCKVNGLLSTHILSVGQVTCDNIRCNGVNSNIKTAKLANIGHDPTVLIFTSLCSAVGRNNQSLVIKIFRQAVVWFDHELVISEDRCISVVDIVHCRVAFCRFCSLRIIEVKVVIQYIFAHINPSILRFIFVLVSIVEHFEACSTCTADGK
ncbi:hypothetical protein D3C72_1547940 [compost metagenome]